VNNVFLALPFSYSKQSFLNAKSYLTANEVPVSVYRYSVLLYSVLLYSVLMASTSASIQKVFSSSYLTASEVSVYSVLMVSLGNLSQYSYLTANEISVYSVLTASLGTGS
jgi:hypothetical protein